MRRFHNRKFWQIAFVAVGYFLFGLVALIIGVFFLLLSPIPIITGAVKQKWIRWCIHYGCLTFIRMMRAFGLLRYSFDVSSLLQTKPGNIVIANHPSLIDAVFMFAISKNLTCLVKSALWDNIFTGAIVRLAGFIPNNTHDAVNMAVEKLQAAEDLLIFPEGTRSEKLDDIHFRRGAANVAVASGAPIIPILIKCYPQVLKKGDNWYDIPDNGADVFLYSRQPLKLQDCIDTTKPKTLQYRELTQFLERYYNNWAKTKTAFTPEKK